MLTLCFPKATLENSVRNKQIAEEKKSFKKTLIRWEENSYKNFFLSISRSFLSLSLSRRNGESFS